MLVEKTIFGPFFDQWDFNDEISNSALLDVQPILLCVCGVDYISPHLPELEHLIEKRFHSLFSQKVSETCGETLGGFVIKMKLRSTSCAEQILSDYLDYLENESKSGDTTVLEIRSQNWSCYPHYVLPEHIDRGSSLMVKHSFVWKLSNM